MSDVAAFLIAGGHSSRMGRDKAFLTLGRSTLLERALAVARSVTGDVMIVGQREKFAAYGTVIEDVYPGQGPLGGIHAALSGSAFELNLMLGVDTPFLDPKFVQYLVEQARKSGAIVTVPVTSTRIPHPVSQKPGETSVGQPPKSSSQLSVVSSQPTEYREPKTDNPAGNQKLATRNSGQHQPLCAVYRREFAAVAESALRQGRNNIVPLFAGLATREITDAEMRKLDFDPRMFDNLNTPEEWDQACRRATT